MRDAALAGISFVEGRTREDLDTDQMLSFALARAVEIIGEAANQITAKTRSSNPAID